MPGTCCAARSWPAPRRWASSTIPSSTAAPPATASLAKLEQRPHLPQLGREDDVERLAQVADAGGAAGAALVADDPLHRLDVAKAPLLEGILEVDQLLGQLVEVPVAAGVAIDREPGVAHRRIAAIGRG